MCCCKISVAQSINSEGLVSINISNQPLGETLDNIAELTNLLFVYNDDLVLDKFITYSSDDTSPHKLLEEIFRQAEISHKTFGKNTIVLFKDSPPEITKGQENLVKVSGPPVVSNLQLISNNQPKYPAKAIDENIQGTVTVKMLISKLGMVDKVEVDKSSGSRMLDNYTVDFVRNLIYKPLLIDGKPQTSWTYITYSYILTQN